jgi:hypothetical protein
MQMTTAEKTETLPSTLNQIRAIASKVFEDNAAESCYIETTFGEVRVTRPTEMGDLGEVYMPTLEYSKFCKFLNGR